MIHINKRALLPNRLFDTMHIPPTEQSVAGWTLYYNKKQTRTHSVCISGLGLKVLSIWVGN